MKYIMRIDEFASHMVSEMAVRPDVFNGFEEVDIFDSTYFIVKNGSGLYNLIDRKGNMISDIWFDKITKNDDGTVETVVSDSNNKQHTATYSDPKEFEVCINVQKDVLDGINIPYDIDLSDIIPITPYQIKTPKNKNTTIIAKVVLDGNELLLGKDGKVYNTDGSEHFVKNSVISASDKYSNMIEYLENELHLVYDKKTRLWNCDGDVKVTPTIVREDYRGFTVDFGVVKGDFDCRENNLTSLEGAPQEVGGNFNCSINKLTTLEGAPQKVGGDFYCSNNNLTTLEGAPSEVVGVFYCYVNKLTSLEGAPQKVYGNFDCRWNKLTSLEGAPLEVGGNFDCSYNNLTTIAGAPQKVGGNFYCSNNPRLVSPSAKPKWVKGKFVK